MVLVYGAIAIGLVLGSIVAFARQPAGAWAVAILGVGLLVPGFNGRIYPADLWIVGAAILAGVAGVTLYVLRHRPGENVPAARTLLGVVAGVIGLGMALLAGGLVIFSGVGLS